MSSKSGYTVIVLKFIGQRASRWRDYVLHTPVRVACTMRTKNSPLRVINLYSGISFSHHSEGKYNLTHTNTQTHTHTQTHTSVCMQHSGVQLCRPGTANPTEMLGYCEETYGLYFFFDSH